MQFLPEKGVGGAFEIYTGAIRQACPVHNSYPGISPSFIIQADETYVSLLFSSGRETIFPFLLLPSPFFVFIGAQSQDNNSGERVGKGENGRELPLVTVELK